MRPIMRLEAEQARVWSSWSYIHLLQYIDALGFDSGWRVRCLSDVLTLKSPSRLKLGEVKGRY